MVNWRYSSSWGSVFEIEIELYSKVDFIVKSVRKFIVEVVNVYY